MLLNQLQAFDENLVVAKRLSWRNCALWASLLVQQRLNQVGRLLHRRQLL